MKWSRVADGLFPNPHQSEKTVEALEVLAETTETSNTQHTRVGVVSDPVPTTGMVAEIEVDSEVRITARTPTTATTTVIGATAKTVTAIGAEEAVEAAKEMEVTAEEGIAVTRMTQTTSVIRTKAQAT
jgi:hypothetical protein